MIDYRSVVLIIAITMFAYYKGTNSTTSIPTQLYSISNSQFDVDMNFTNSLRQTRKTNLHVTLFLPTISSITYTHTTCTH